MRIRKDDEMDSSWIAFQKENNKAKYYILLFPHSGAGASVFASWGKVFQKNHFNFYPIQYPMREGRKNEEMPSSLTEIAREIAESLMEVFKKNRYILYGRCTGSLVAYEVARYVYKKLGIHPKLFVAASALSPNDCKLEPMDDKASSKEWAKKFIDLHFLDPNVVQDEMFLEFYMPVLKADYKMQVDYQCIPDYQLECHIYTLYGKEDKVIDGEKLEHWQAFTKNQVHQVGFTGEHFFENRENLGEICNLIQSAFVHNEERSSV